ncbi:MAG: phosphoglycerate kinase [Christensenellaceae bacterium]|jgi:3-phosphoglycerate kinase|nr:phosphoglycerate kinase [Christensenellaceae bacterium]
MKKMDKATLKDVNNLVGRRVLIRVDYNVPMNSSGVIADDNKIRQSLITIKYCLGHGAKVILCSHFGRPDGNDPKYSLEPVCYRLRKLLPKTTIYFAHNCIGDSVETQAAALQNGEILLLENTRFHEEEAQNDPDFAKKLASLADIFVNDAFASSHRAHASTVGVTEYLPAVAGFLIEKELIMLSAVACNPARPLTVISGGKKVSDKLGVVEHLFGLADNVLIGGGMVYTFIKAMGGKVGNSIVDETKIDYCRECIEKAKGNVNLVIASDTVVATEIKAGVKTKTVPSMEIPDGYSGADIGAKTIAQFTDIINKSATIFWNGTMGVSEIAEFENGTKAIAEAIATGNAISVVGGGDTASEVVRLAKPQDFTHISTGGGASLEFIEGKELPGIKALLSPEEFNRMEEDGGTKTK